MLASSTAGSRGSKDTTSPSLWTSQICFHLTVSLEAYLQCWECHVHTLTVISPKEYSVPLSSHSYVHPRRWDSALDQLQLHVHLGAADMQFAPSKHLTQWNRSKSFPQRNFRIRGMSFGWGEAFIKISLVFCNYLSSKHSKKPQQILKISFKMDGFLCIRLPT